MKLYVDEKELGICKNELQNHHFLLLETQLKLDNLIFTITVMKQSF